MTSFIFKRKKAQFLYGYRIRIHTEIVLLLRITEVMIVKDGKSASKMVELAKQIMFKIKRLNLDLQCFNECEKT